MRFTLQRTFLLFLCLVSFEASARTKSEALTACQNYIAPKQGHPSYTYSCVDQLSNGQPAIVEIIGDNLGGEQTGAAWYYDPLPECEPPNTRYEDPVTGQMVCGIPLDCKTDTIPGGSIMSSGGSVGGGAGVYNVNSCAYTCGINFSKLDGQTSVYDAQECTGLGQPWTSEDPAEYENPPEQCDVKDSQGNCLDMDKQDGGSCPTGTTYGQVNGTNVCVPSGTPTDGLDEGSKGPDGQGGDQPENGGNTGGDGDGDGNGDGTGDGDGNGDGSGDGEGDGDGSGGGGGGTGDGEEEDPGEYGSNACESAPTCSGDAIQCGIVREVWENRCLIHETGEKADEFFSQKTQGVGNLDDEGLALVDSKDFDLSDKMQDFANVSDPAPAQCPPPTDIRLALGTFQVEFTPYCDLAEQLRPLTIFIFTFLGALAVARTVMGVI